MQSAHCFPAQELRRLGGRLFQRPASGANPMGFPIIAHGRSGQLAGGHKTLPIQALNALLKSCRQLMIGDADEVTSEREARNDKSLVAGYFRVVGDVFFLVITVNVDDGVCAQCVRPLLKFQQS